MGNIQRDNGAQGVTFSVAGGFWNGTWSPAGPGAQCYFQLPAHHGSCTAVKVTATQSVPQLFFGKSGSVTRTAVAALTPEDGFNVGSYPSSLPADSQQTGVLNDILSGLGTTANLSGSSVVGLDNSYVSIQQLITASGGLLTKSNVLTTQLTSAQWLTLLSTALYTQQSAIGCGASPTPSVCIAYAALGTLTFGSSASAQLCQIVTVGSFGCGPENLSQAGLLANLNVLQTLTTLAEVSNGSTPIDIQNTLGVTGVSDSTLTLVVVQPPQIAYGAAGSTTSATSALISADLKLTVPGAGIVDVPVSQIQATGTLTAPSPLAPVSCSQSNESLTTATVTASSTSSTTNVTLSGNPSPIATLTVSGVSSQNNVFTAAQIPPTASTQTSSANPNPILDSATTSLSGYDSSSPVYSELTHLGPAIGPVLQAAGMPVGGFNVADLDYNCGAVSIVQ